jgi:uncharacterized repeat protein (TIGR01451 family)
MSQKGRRYGGEARPPGSGRGRVSTLWRLAAASSLAGLATVTAGLMVAGPAGATTGTAASSLNTVVDDAGTASAWSGLEMTGASAFDTATVSGHAGAVPSGTVDYQLFDGPGCSGPVVSSQTVTVDSSGTVPVSSPTAALGAATYSYEASYSGDDTYAPASAACEPFTVWPAYDSTDVVVYDAQTHGPWSGLETTGASVYEKASINSVPGFTPTGTVTYKLLSLPDATACDGTVLSTQTVALTSKGTVPRSSDYGPLAPGFYEYQAVYSGDSNHRSSSTSECAGQFTVAQTSPLTATQTAVYDATSDLPWSGQEVAGDSAYDTATISTHSGTTPTGTVTYTLYSGNCSGSGTVIGKDTVTLNPAGTVPNSTPSGPLTAGTYCYHVSYSGDAGNNPSTDGCGEQFKVLPGVPEISAVKTSDAGSAYVQPGQTITYTVTVTNAGLGADNAVTVTDSNPEGTTYVPGSAQCPTGLVGVTCNVSATTGTSGPTQIQWVLSMPAATLSQGAVVPVTAAVTFQVAVDASPGECAAIDNTASVNDTQTNPVNLEAAYPSLQLSLTAVPHPMTSPGTGRVSQGELITYTLHWSNTGLADVPGATVTDTVPAGATYVAGSAGDGGTFDAGTVTWPGLDMVSGASGTLTFQVTVDHADQDGFQILNQAQVSGPAGSQPVVTTGAAGCSSPTPAWSAASNQTLHVVAVTSTTTTVPPTTPPTTPPTVPPTTPPTTTAHNTPVTPTTAAATTGQGTTSSTDPVGLAFTGGNTLRGLEAAGVVLAGGALLVLASRRGRNRKS